MSGPLYVRGASSLIVKHLTDFGIDTVEVERNCRMPNLGQCWDGTRYLFCQGFIQPKKITEQTEDEIKNSFWANAGYIIRECQRLLDENESSRICIVGSESGYKWSYDGAYAASKAALHRFVECKRLKHAAQQLVAVAPTCIGDTPSIINRDADGQRALCKRLENHPKRRWLTSFEVARMINYLLYVDSGYTTNTVIRMNGGEHCGDSW